MAASGHQAEAAKKATMDKYKGEYILCVEGSVPLGADGNYCCIAGKSALEILKESAAGAKAIIAWEVVQQLVVFKRLNLIQQVLCQLKKLSPINLLLMFRVVHQLER